MQVLRGACTEHPDPDLWFPPRGPVPKGGHEAAKICEEVCWVLDACAELAKQVLKDIEVYPTLHGSGIWAGKPLTYWSRQEIANGKHGKKVRKQ